MGSIWDGTSGALAVMTYLQLVLPCPWGKELSKDSPSLKPDGSPFYHVICSQPLVKGRTQGQRPSPPLYSLRFLFSHEHVGYVSCTLVLEARVSIHE